MRGVFTFVVLMLISQPTWAVDQKTLPGAIAQAHAKTTGLLQEWKAETNPVKKALLKQRAVDAIRDEQLLRSEALPK